MVMFLDWLATATVFDVFCLLTAANIAGVIFERALAYVCEGTRGS